MSDFFYSHRLEAEYYQQEKEKRKVEADILQGIKIAYLMGKRGKIEDQEYKALIS